MLDGGPGGRIRAVPVDVTRDAYAAVPQQICDCFDMHTGIQPCRRGAVAESVHTDVLQPGLGRRRLDGSQDITRLNRGAEFGRKYQARLAPLVSGF